MKMQIEDIKSSFNYRIFNVLTVMATLTVAAGMLRIPVIGMTADMVVGFIAYVAYMIAYFLLRDKNPRILLLVMVSGLTIASFINLYTVGPTSFGFTWLVITAAIMAVNYPKVHTIVFMVVCTCYILLIAYGFITEQLVIPVDANIYVASLGTWAALIVTSILFAFFLVYSMKIYDEKLLEAHSVIVEQNQQLEMMANHDQLTRLPTLRLTRELAKLTIEQAKRDKKKCGLLFIDLDGFKQINDTYGHAAGDAVLIAIADRLTQETRSVDTPCRIGGDELLIILGELESSDEITSICGRLIAAINEPIYFDDQALHIGASIGASIYPTNGEHFEVLKDLADQAMYEAKGSGKNNYRIVS